MLQNAKDMFNDKKIIVYPFLSSFTYMDKLTEELGIPKYKEEKKENIVNICQHTNSPFIVSVTKINPMYKRKLIKKDNRRYLL